MRSSIGTSAVLAVLLAYGLVGAAFGQASADVTAGPVVINEVMASNSKTLQDPQEQYEDWIELYNPGDSPVNVGGMYLTDDIADPCQWRIPNATIAPKGYLLIWADGDTTAEGLHANFNLSAEGEEIALFAADGNTPVDHVAFGRQVGDVSYGRFPNGSDSWRYLNSPTPGAANDSAYEGIVEDVEFSQERGFRESAFLLWLVTGTRGATIYYTLDGRDPVNAGGEPIGVVYDGPISIGHTTCVRAAAVKTGWMQSRTRTATYIFLDDVARQSASPAGFPTNWGANHVDYEVDPDVVNALAYAATFKDDLQTIPSVALSMSNDDFFDATSGIYANPGKKGTSGWAYPVERAASIEWIDPVKQTSFQVNAGLRIQGGVGRSTSVSKHSFRVLFKGAYGPSQLEYPVFEDGDGQRYDGLVLRAIWNYSWFGDSTACGGLGTSHADYLRDLFAKNTVRDMGDLAVRGRPVHVYLNGLYWGLYLLAERPDAGFAANHLGGDKEDYDILRVSNGTSQVVPQAGDMAAWYTLFGLAAADLSLAENYQAIQQCLDVPAMIDYMLMVYLTGSRDAPTYLCHDSNPVPRNFYVIRRREPAGPLQFMAWDVEWALERTTENRIPLVGRDNPHYLVNKLNRNPDFRMLMADRIYRFFFNDEALASGRCIERYGLLAQEIDRAIVGESARWGDAKRADLPYTRDADWVFERDRLLKEYFPVRTGIVLDQLREAGFYPAISPPQFYVNDKLARGGHFKSGDLLDMNDTNPGDGTIWYTLDGSDPRLPGSRSGNDEMELVAENAAKKVLVPTIADKDIAWQGVEFDDSAWTSGIGGVGYETSTDYRSYFSMDVQSQMYGKTTSCYIRVPFTVAATDIGAFSTLTLSVRCDDGFIAYINGVEVARQNFTGPPAWDSRADGSALDADAMELKMFDVSAFLGHLVAGDNILALQALNDTVRSSDFLMSEILTASRAAGSIGISPTALEYTNPVPLTISTQVKARVLSDGTWSPLNEAIYAVGPVAESLRISEIMYHPLDPNTEFIELTNIGSATVNLNLVRFTQGIEFTFGNVELAPKAHVVVVEDLAAFTARYSRDVVPVAGQYSGSLSNGGERIRLEDAAGQVTEDSAYRDGWYDITDGAGFSLTVKRSAMADPNVLVDKSAWRPSARSGGSPGTDDSGVVPELGEVVINEVLANGKKGEPDWIELCNTTGHAIDLGGWFLSDDANELTRYEIAAGTSLPAGGYLVFWENLHFGNTADPGCHAPFGLSKNGETVYLHSGSAGVVTGYVEEETLGATETGVSLGRYKKSTGAYNFVEMSKPTPEAANAAPKVGPIVIGEIMYHPTDIPDAEYVELLNVGNLAVTLFDADANLPWRFTDDPEDPAVELLLPSSPPVVLLPGQRLVLTKNPDAFALKFGAPAGVSVLGWGVGWLSDAGEKIQLSKPNGNGYWIRVDRVVYSDGTHPDFGASADPWPAAAEGKSLTRINPTAYGNDPNNWQASTPTPGLAP